MQTWTQTRYSWQQATLSIAVGALLAGLALTTAQATQQNTPSQSSLARLGEPVTLNFFNAEIADVARTMATITGRNVVVDPRVRGQLNLVTENAVSPEVAIDQFLAALRLHGYTMVEAAGLYKVVPEADAKLQGGAVKLHAQATAPNTTGNQIVTQIFKLNFENVNNLVPILRPLISPSNTININPSNNSIVITDYADNLQRMAKIIAAMDVSNASDIEIINLQHAIASDLAPLISRLLESSANTTAGQADGAYKTTLIAEPRSNALILRAANPARIALVKSLVQKLDQPTAAGVNGDAGNIYVVHLKNADATQMAATLRAAISGEANNSGTNLALTNTSTNNNASSNSTNSSTSSSSSLSNVFGQSSNQASTGGQIQADPSTNSLIITAPEPQYRQLRAVIDKLDGRRAQVMVESLIVEVSADKAAEFGVQWQTMLGKSGNSNVGLIGTNSGVGGANIIDIATGLALGSSSSSNIKNLVKPSTGFNFGIGHKFGDQYALSFLARFLENTGESNILSTPNLLTLDNEEAKIVIGQNVPFITGSTLLNSGATTNPYTSVERKDVGLTLRIKPQINENGTIKMAIFQEVSSVLENTVTNANGPTTNKRSVESNVLVDDGSIVVIAGLLQEDYGSLQEKVPGFGDLPLFGNLFKNEKRTRKKTNLMIFLRPVVIRDALASDALATDRYEMMRAIQQKAQPTANAMLPGITDAPVLPPLNQAARDQQNSALKAAQEASTPAAPKPKRDALPGALPPTSDPLYYKFSS